MREDRSGAPIGVAVFRAGVLHPWHEDGDRPLRGEVFVFGSNLAGIHGAGAALLAREKYGAVLGQGSGYQGAHPAHCFAIPTKDERLRVLPLDTIARGIEAFLRFHSLHKDCRFFLTRVGCGLAGYRDEQIAPLFRGLDRERVSIPKQWIPFLGQ